MKKFTVTEENFNEVLEKLQKICNKYKMLEINIIINEKNEVIYKHSSFGLHRVVVGLIDKDGTHNGYKIMKKFFSYNKYVRITKNRFREKFEQGIDDYDVKHFYQPTHPLINIELAYGSGLVIYEHDKIQFLPFGGFIIYNTDNDCTGFGFERTLQIYKKIFIPDYINGKIINLEEENNIRDKEITDMDQY